MGDQVVGYKMTVTCGIASCFLDSFVLLVLSSAHSLASTGTRVEGV